MSTLTEISQIAQNEILLNWNSVLDPILPSQKSRLEAVLFQYHIRSDFSLLLRLLQCLLKVSQHDKQIYRLTRILAERESFWSISVMIKDKSTKEWNQHRTRDIGSGGPITEN